MSPNNLLFWYNGMFIHNFGLILFLATDKAAYLHFQAASLCSGNTNSKMTKRPRVWGSDIQSRLRCTKTESRPRPDWCQLNAVQSVFNIDVCNTCTTRTLCGNQEYKFTEITILISRIKFGETVFLSIGPSYSFQISTLKFQITFSPPAWWWTNYSQPWDL